MRNTVTLIFTFLTMTIFAQPKGYTTIDNFFAYHVNEFNDHKLSGNIKSFQVYKKENENFHSKKTTIQLSSGMNDCHKYLFESNLLSEVHFLNSDGSLRFIRRFSKGLIEELVFYQSSGIAQGRETFVYDDAGKLVEKNIKDANDNIEFNIKYNYDEKNRLASVIGGESYNYKYIYDEFGGFYEVKYSDYKDLSTIHEVRYNRYTDKEELNVILQNEPKTKFEDVRNLNKVWQSATKLDNQKRIVFEQSSDLRLNEVNIESSFNYNNDNQLVSKTFKTKNGTNDTYTFVYQNSKLIKQIAQDEKGVENFNQLLQYNNRGDLIKKHNKGTGIKEEIYEYEYTYDKNGNWTQKKEIVNQKLFEIIFREIEYGE